MKIKKKLPDERFHRFCRLTTKPFVSVIDVDCVDCFKVRHVELVVLNRRRSHFCKFTVIGSSTHSDRYDLNTFLLKL